MQNDLTGQAMTPREELIYVILDAMDHPPVGVSVTRKAAAVLAAIEAHAGGCVVVPIEVNDDMALASDAHEEMGQDCWETMLSASPYAPDATPSPRQT